ncbi:glucose PTS transporter subunit IIA [Mycoplasma sp. Z386]
MKFFFKTKSKDKVVVNDKNFSAKAKLILSKISGAFLLPIAVMAIAGLFLGIGATIENLSSGGGKVFGIFIKQLGQPIFDALPLLFAAAFVVSFTNDAGTAVFSAIVGYFVFLALQVPFISPVYETLSNSSQVTAGNVNNIVVEVNKQGEIVYKELKGYVVLFGGAGRSLESSLQIVKSSFGILSLQTSIFGSIIVGILISYLYNKFYKIQLPQMISFFGGKRFVPIVSIVAMIPLTFLFLIFWPWIGAGLTAFGKLLNKAPVGLESLVFGIIERSLIPFGLHHAFYAPLWYTNVGGDVYSSLGDALKEGGPLSSTNYALQENWKSYITATELYKLMAKNPTKWAGDSLISNSALSLEFNNVVYNVNGKTEIAPVFTFFEKQLGIKVGRYLQGKYPFMQFALPAAAAAMVMAAPKENRKIALSSVVPSALTSFVTGVTEPIEFTFLFLAPYMFWGFHAIMAGFAFMFMNILGAHIGQTFSGGILDLIIYGAIPVLKGTNFWWWAVIGIAYAPIYYFVFYFVIKKMNLETPGRGSNTKLFTKADFKNQKSSKQTTKSSLNAQETEIVLAFGGWENIESFNNCASRLRYDILDKTKVNEERLKAAGAKGVKFIGDKHVQVIFGPVAEQLNSKISSHKGEKLVLDNEEKQENEIQQDTNNNMNLDNKEVVKFKNITSGTVKDISEINDGVFSEKMLGDGIIISPDATEKIVKIYSPFDGVATTVFPTKHAYGLTTKEGINILIHIGIDTVNLSGKGFTSFIEQGSEVKEGQLIAEVDMEYLKTAVEKTDIVYIVISDSTRTEVINKQLKNSSKDEIVFEVK